MILSTRPNPVKIDSTEFINNKALNETPGSGLGGAIALEYGNVELTSVLFDGNSANDGGAIANWYDQGDHPANHSELTSTDTRYIGNTALNHGGAISFKDTEGTLKSERDTYKDNTAAFGGAIFNGSKKAEITDSTFTSNKATAAQGAGGAIYNAAGGKIDIDGATFTGTPLLLVALSTTPLPIARMSLLQASYPFLAAPLKTTRLWVARAVQSAIRALSAKFLIPISLATVLTMAEPSTTEQLVLSHPSVVLPLPTTAQAQLLLARL